MSSEVAKSESPHSGLSVKTVPFDNGMYNGTVETSTGLAQGQGRLDYNETDELGRKCYQGHWEKGKNTGRGKMIFVTGDVYEGDFEDGIPHGQGQFTYASTGDVETAQWENGNRHGLSRYVSAADQTVEEVMFWEGIAEGPAVVRSADGSVEEFHYNQGTREGRAVRKLHSGEVLEFTYVDGEVSGEAKLTRPDGSYEDAIFCNGVKEGASVEFLPDGSREEHSYAKGELQGHAVVYGVNGDRLEFSYKNGKRFGPMAYYFHDGSVEMSFYDESGVQSGPTQFTWPNGAKREGHKVNGKWDGQVFYLFAEGPRKGKRDVETWEAGEMVSSQKFYGGGQNVMIQDWEDLKKLQPLGESCSPDKDVFYDCISQKE